MIDTMHMDINARDEKNATLLHYACLSQKGIATFLIKTYPKIKLNAQDENKTTPLRCACLANNIEFNS